MATENHAHESRACRFPLVLAPKTQVEGDTQYAVGWTWIGNIDIEERRKLDGYDCHGGSFYGIAGTQGNAEDGFICRLWRRGGCLDCYCDGDGSIFQMRAFVRDN